MDPEGWRRFVLGEFFQVSDKFPSLILFSSVYGSISELSTRTYSYLWIKQFPLFRILNQKLWIYGSCTYCNHYILGVYMGGIPIECNCWSPEMDLRSQNLTTRILYFSYLFWVLKTHQYLPKSEKNKEIGWKFWTNQDVILIKDQFFQIVCLQEWYLRRSNVHGKSQNTSYWY